MVYLIDRFMIMINDILSMFEYAARDEPTTVKQLSEVHGVIKMCMKGTSLLKENSKSPGTVFLSMCSHNLVDIMQREYNLCSQQKGKKLRYRHR